MPPLEVLKVVLALLAVIGMIVLVRYGSRFAPSLSRRETSGAVLRLEASLALDQKRRLCLVNCQDRRLLLLTGGASDVMLGWLPEPGGGNRAS